jgi:hypothetical protein
MAEQNKLHEKGLQYVAEDKHLLALVDLYFHKTGFAAGGRVMHAL